MPATQILYDDDYMRVIWHPGQSPFLLITLGDLLTEVDGHRFFADTPVGKAGIACIGFVSKGAHFYPTASVRAAALAIEAVAGGFRERVLYGGSMGGYGAIKHARRLGASTVIALCPQWSIDPAECEGHFPGWPHLMKPSLAGMGIRPEEIQGAVFVFSDLFDEVDRFQAGMIRRADPSATIINVPLVEHHVTGVFAGTQNLLDLIAACRARQIPALIALSRRTRKNSPRRLTTLFLRGLERHPELTYRVMATRPSPDPVIGPVGARHLFQAVGALAGRGAAAAAMGYVETYRHELREPADILAAGALLGRLSGREMVVTTHHQTVVVYDFGLRRCVHVAVVNHLKQVPVRLRAGGGVARIHVVAGGVEFSLGIGEGGWLTERHEGETNFTVGSRYNGAVTFNSAGMFVSAEPEGEVRCDRDIAYEWEHFRFSNNFLS